MNKPPAPDRRLRGVAIAALCSLMIDPGLARMQAGPATSAPAQSTAPSPVQPPPQQATLTAPPADLSPLERIRQIRSRGGSRDTARIIGGTAMDYAANAWQIALVDATLADNFEAQFCGGSYLGGRWVLTAAHCATDPIDQYQVLYGSATLTDSASRRVAILRKVLHPGYVRSTHDNDIALLELASPLQTERIAIASPAEFLTLVSGRSVRVTGWGAVDDVGTGSRILLGAEPPLQANATCNRPDAYGGKVTGNMICAGIPTGGQDSCQGDSGGPATVAFGSVRKLIGVVSWGYGCGLAKRYGVYARASNYQQWIANNTLP